MESIGRYQILEPIARGGMGAVYRARHEDLRREVALKVLLGGPKATQVQRKRFLREARAVSRLEHPNIVRVWDVGEAGERLYMVMDLVRGESLQDLLDRAGPLPPLRAAQLCAALAAAMHHAHQRGVLHRDLKPANVLLDPAGQPLLTDFGLSRELDPTLSSTQLTGQGQALGTPGYWSPEQAQGQRERIDVRTDVYGLGATLFALLTAQPPQLGENLLQLMQALREPPRRPSQVNPATPAELDAICLRCLALAPEERFPDMQALGAALRALLASPSPTGAGARRRLPARGLWLLVLPALGLLGWGLRAPAAPTPSPSPPATPAEPRYPLPADPRAQAWTGQAERDALAGDDEGAVAALTLAAQLAPENVQVLLRRARILARLGDLAGARRDYTRLLELAPGDPELWVARSVVEERLGAAQAAAADLRRALALDSLAPARRDQLQATLTRLSASASPAPAPATR